MVRATRHGVGARLSERAPRQLAVVDHMVEYAADLAVPRTGSRLVQQCRDLLMLRLEEGLRVVGEGRRGEGHEPHEEECREEGLL